MKSTTSGLINTPAMIIDHWARIEALPTAGVPGRTHNVRWSRRVGLRRAAADQEHRAVTRLGLRQRRDRVGHSRTGSDSGYPTFARDLCPPLCGEGGRLLVADVDDPDAVLGRAGEDRPDVAAVESEQMSCPGAFQRQGDQLTSVYCIHAYSAMANGMAGVLKAA